MTYAITETFYTLQGEGYHAGTAAQFIRFAGCNLWSGRDEHRKRDGTRNDVACPGFCDTDFLARQRLDAQGLVDELDGPTTTPLVVLTGGEPLLQVDAPLIEALRERFPAAIIAVETNGTQALPCPGIDWVCVSPKVEPDRLALRTGDELKVVVPAYEPERYAAIAHGFRHRWVSAEAQTLEVGRSLVVAERLRTAAAWVMANPSWRLTVQAHKIIGVP